MKPTMGLRSMAGLIISLAAILNSLEAVTPPDKTVHLDDLLHTNPVDEMIRQIDSKVESDTEAVMHRHHAVLGLSLDDDIEKAAELRERGTVDSHQDIGEGNEITQGSTSRSQAARAAAMRALKTAQASLNKAQGMNSNAPTAAIEKLSNTKVADAKGTPKTGTPEFDGYQPEDPVDEMKSLIDSQVKSAERMATEQPPEDPLDKAIDQIKVVRAREKVKAQVRSNLANAKYLANIERNAETFLQESESAPGDPGQTLPQSKVAPPGPPNAPVKEVEEQAPAKLALGRSTVVAPPPGAGLDTALRSQSAPLETEKPVPPAIGKDFSMAEIDEEVKSIDAYPISRDEAINEAVGKLVPWHQRPDPPNKKAKGPGIPETEVKTTPDPSGGGNSTAADITTAELNFFNN